MGPNDNMASELLSLKPQRDRQGGGQEMMDGARPGYTAVYTLTFQRFRHLLN